MIRITDRKQTFLIIAAVIVVSPLIFTTFMALIKLAFVSAPTLGDVDGDGDLDAVIGEIDGTILFYRNTGTTNAPTFSLETGSANPFDGVDVGFHSAPTLGDVDGDGDLDAFIGEYDGIINFYRNIGTATAPTFTEVAGSGNPLNGVDVGFHSVPTLGDVDGDGDLETGSANPFNGVDVGFHSGPTLGDVDGDGDLDAFIGEYDGIINFYRNTGTATAPSFSLETGTLFSSVDMGNYSAPTLGDVDGDGDPDAFIGEQSGIINFYRNTGMTAAPSFSLETGSATPFNGVSVGSDTAAVLGDVDGDGDLDAFIGEYDGIINFYRNTGTIIAPTFTEVAGSGNPLNDVDVKRLSAPTLYGTLVLLNLGLILSLVMAITSAKGLLVQFVQRLYNLSLKDAEGLVNRILYGLPKSPPLDPTLRVDKGRVDPDGPEVMRKVGGPGFLSVGHDSAAVIAQGGTIVDVLGPGFHHLDPFMKVWDVVDLRPQRREVKVNANTRDGIPVYCVAEVCFRVDNGKPLPTQESPSPYPFTETARESILKLTTTKVVLAPGGKVRYSDWTKRIPAGIVDGKVRDRIEQFRMDEIIALRVAEEEATIRDRIKQSLKNKLLATDAHTDADAHRKSLLIKLEEEITNAVRENASTIGVRIEEVRLGPVLPAEDAISQQWLETWCSQWDTVATKIKTEAAATEAERMELTRIHAQADLLTTIVQKMQSPNMGNAEIPPSFVLLRFMDVIRSLADSDPMVRSTMFLQAESLQRIIESVRDAPRPQASQEQLPAPRQQG